MHQFREKIPGGRAAGMSPAQFDAHCLAHGAIHEMEHTDDPETAMEIAMDHLVEHPDYYEILEAMEGQMSPPDRMMVPNVAAAVAEEAYVIAREAPVIAQALRAAAPEVVSGARVMLPRMATTIARAGKWLNEGLSESRVVKMLVESGIPKRAALAFKDAAKDFLAGELQDGAQKIARRLLDGRRGGGATSAERRPRVERTQKMTPNRSPPYYVWVIDPNFEPVEGPFGPYSYISAKHFARIGATQGEHPRAVSLGLDPESKKFRVQRIYEAGTGERLR